MNITSQGYIILDNMKDDGTRLRVDGQSYEYLWVYWTSSSKWEFWKQNTEQIYMTQDEASKAYDSLFPIEATKRLRINNGRK
jgi:hypothetical protein